MYLKMLRSILKAGHFYYSSSYDLTNRIQKNRSLSNEDKSKPVWERVSSA